MAFRQRNVIGFVFDADGNPQTNVPIKFTPTKPFGYTSLHIVLNDPVTVQSQTGGSFVAALWCDEDSLIPIDYDLVISTDVKRTGKISLAFEDGTDKPIGDLLLASASSADLVGRETVLNLIDTQINAALEDFDGGSGGGSAALRFLCTPRLTPITTTGNIYSELITKGGTISEIVAYLVNPAGSGTFAVDIKKNGTTILSTPLTIDATESSSLTAAAAAVLSSDSISKGDILSVSITDAADGTATGLFIYVLTGTPEDVVADVEPPTVPTELSLTPSPTSISATYTDAADNVGVASYEFRINGGGLTNDIRTGGLTKPFIITGLTASTAYQIAVRAKDAAGNASAWSANQSATTTAAASSDLLLDKFSESASAAVGLRKLRNAYTGAAMRIVRASDNVQTDIAFDTNKKADASAVTAFGASTTLKLVKLYDQSGNSNDFASPAGAVVTVVGGEVVITNSTSSPRLRSVAAITSTLPKTFFVIDPGDASANYYLQDFSDNRLAVSFFSNSYRLYDGIAGDNTGATTGKQQLTGLFNLDHTGSVFKNGTQVGTDAVVRDGAETTVSATVTLVGYGGLDGYSFTGKFYEWIYFETISNASKTIIENDQKTFWGIG